MKQERFIITKGKDITGRNEVYFVKEYVDERSPAIIIAQCSTELNAARVKRALKIVEGRKFGRG